MNSSAGLKGGSRPTTFLERFYEAQLDENNMEDVFTKLVKSIFARVVHRVEPSSSSQISLDKTSLVTTEQADRRNDMVRVTYISGNVYEGHMSKWNPSGAGRLSLDDGAVVYEGRFDDGLPNGRGTIKWSDGSWYDGEVRNGVRHGRGLHVSAEDGRRWYAGQWTNGRRNGTGKTACAGEPDGALDYDGEWANGRPHGNGTGRWPDGTTYTGNWTDGRPHGRGKTVWPRNDVYDGDWVDGRMDGTGKYEWSSNPRDSDWLVLCVCDKYDGQWWMSKKHGPGVFYSEATGATIRGRWTDDALDGPCEIVLATDKASRFAGLVFRHNVLYVPPPPPAISRTATGRGCTVSVSAVGRDRARPGAKPATNTVHFQHPCEPRIVRGRLVRANIRLTAAADAWTVGDLTGHVRKMAAKCSKDVECRSFNAVASPPTMDMEPELRATALALNTHWDQLQELYRAYGTFLANGPVAYRPTMTRLGLWQLLVDSRLHAVLSLADFDDLLYENDNYAFDSAHEPFEPIRFWQFVHAVCELAIVVYDTRRIQSSQEFGNCKTMASALHVLLTEHVTTDLVPESYAVTAGGKQWTNKRTTIAGMYDVYRTMATADWPLPTARLLIRLYGPRVGGGPSLSSVLPAVLDAMFDLENGRDDECAYAAATSALFECSVASIVSLLSEACPRIVDGRGVLVDADTRLTFAEWYRFVLLCVRDTRRHVASDVGPL